MRSRVLAYADAAFYAMPALFPLLRLVKRPVKRGIAERLAPYRWLPHVGRVAAAKMELSVLRPLAVAGGAWSATAPGRRRGKLIIVVHRADKAGDHVEMYVEDSRTGICHNVGVAKLEKTPKLNNQGWLTEASQEEAIQLIRRKGEGRDWIAFSTDHQPWEARASWNRREDGPAGYGAGQLRQVIREEPIEFTSDGSTIEFQSWELNSWDRTYVHVVFPPDGKRSSPVGVIGFRRQPEPEFNDRLHLTFDGQDPDRFRRNLPGGRASLKIDGASTHFVVDKDGARFFSPRRSKENGRRIEYSPKLGQLQDLRSEEKIVGMGELVFVDKRTGKQLGPNQIGGLLNSDELPPEHLEARVYVYRIDKVGRKDVVNEPYWESNRPRCEQLAGRHRQLAVPREVPMDQLESTRNEEGVVGIAAGEPIANGRKLKWRGDHRYVVVTRVEFEPGEKGGVAGVVWYEDPEAPGREFKTASGFTHEEKLDMMRHPKRYEGRCMKISGYEGHGSRAAKFEGWHLDK